MYSKKTVTCFIVTVIDEYNRLMAKGNQHGLTNRKDVIDRKFSILLLFCVSLNTRTIKVENPVG